MLKIYEGYVVKCFLVNLQQISYSVYAHAQLFDRVRSEHPAALAKVVPVVGDCGELGLGLSPEHRRLLQDNVSFVIHCAATVRFDEPIKKAALLNVRGTREVVELARSFKDLKVHAHRQSGPH